MFCEPKTQSMNKIPIILVVEDDFTSRTVLTSMLRQEGFETLAASTIQAARQMMEQKSFDMAIMDVNLPDGNGLELCRWLKNESPGREVPALFISSDATIQTKLAGFDAGAVDYITKPFNRAEVLARVRMHLRLFQAYQSMLELQAIKLAQLANAQRAMLPQPESLPEAQFQAFYQPLQEAGGDFYQVLPIGRRIHDYIIADVCGHDVGTAMTTAALQALIRQNGSVLYAPNEILKNINQVVRGIMAEGQYVTLMHARLNRQTNRLVLTGAGHPPAILQKMDGAFELLWLEGDVVGAFDNPDFGTVEQAVRPGDRLFLYSDALIECGASDWRAGAGRVIAHLKQLPRASLADTISEIIQFRLKSGGAADDITLIGTEV